MTPPVLGFHGRYRFLSNFFIEPDGTHVEGEYQAAKCVNPTDVARFKGLTPGQAKRLGRRVQCLPDWDEVKVTIMEAYVYQKFTDHVELWVLLKATLDAELVEVNTWGDHFWGVCDDWGDNELGKVLMRVRAML